MIGLFAEFAFWGACWITGRWWKYLLPGGPDADEMSLTMSVPEVRVVTLGQTCRITQLHEMKWALLTSFSGGIACRDMPRECRIRVGQSRPSSLYEYQGLVEACHAPSMLLYILCYYQRDCGICQTRTCILLTGCFGE